MQYKVTKSSLSGVIEASPSKSHTLRAVLFAGMAKGESQITHYLSSPDVLAMVEAIRQLGAEVLVTPEKITVVGNGGMIKNPDDVIDAGNSGQVLRFVAGILALQENYAVLTGDHSIRHNRPMQPLIDGINQLGGFCVATKNDGYAPIIVRGPIKPGKARISGEDSQPVSALLIAAAFLGGVTEVTVDNMGEKPWVDVTIGWLNRIGINCENDNYARYVVHGGANYAGFNYAVVGDFSSILFPVVAAAVTNSAITKYY